MPRDNSNLPHTIEPLHLALAVCDWIGGRQSELEPPDVLLSAPNFKQQDQTQDVLRADDFRNFATIRRAAMHAATFALVAISAVGAAKSQLSMYGPANAELARIANPQATLSNTVSGWLKTSSIPRVILTGAAPCARVVVEA